MLSAPDDTLLAGNAIRIAGYNINKNFAARSNNPT
jgi:hypothetical protein